MIVKAKTKLKGFKSSSELAVLVDTGAVMTVMDKALADAVGVEYTGRTRSLTSATGDKLHGEIAVVRELTVEEETLDYERVLVIEFNDGVKKSLKNLDLGDSLILGITTVESASLIPDTTTGKLRKVEAFLFHTP